MTTVIVSFVAVISTASFLTLWFWGVYRELIGKRNMVRSAEIQRSACRKKRRKVSNEKQMHDTKVVLARSEDIYHQAVMLYNDALSRPQNRIPGFFMGFRRIKDESE